MVAPVYTVLTRVLSNYVNSLQSPERAGALLSCQPPLLPPNVDVRQGQQDNYTPTTVAASAWRWPGMRNLRNLSVTDLTMHVCDSEGRTNDHGRAAPIAPSGGAQIEMLELLRRRLGYDQLLSSVFATTSHS